MSLEERLERKLKLLQETYDKQKKINDAKEKIRDEEYRDKFDRLMTKKNVKKEKQEIKKKRKGLIIKARDKEDHLDYEGALKIWEYIGSKKEAKRLRQKIIDGKKVEQTVVHGDYIDDRDTTYIDDRDTIIKDSVVNRSNIGGGSKAEGLREAKSLFEEGLIDESEYKQMKKEILGK